MPIDADKMRAAGLCDAYGSLILQQRARLYAAARRVARPSVEPVNEKRRSTRCKEPWIPSGRS